MTLDTDRDFAEPGEIDRNDARLVALNRNTGKVIWNKQIANYQAGYSATAAPIIVKGMVITGNSGGEFGIIGAVEARDGELGRASAERRTHLAPADHRRKYGHATRQG